MVRTDASAASVGTRISERGRRALLAAVVAVQILVPLSVRAQPVTLPIVEKPHEHEAALGYAPWYTPNAPAFDKFNRPYMRSRAVDPQVSGSIQTIRNGRWVQRDFLGAIRAAFPNFASVHLGGGTLGACISFDSDDHLYTLVRVKFKDDSEHDLLLYSPDYGDTFQVYELPCNEGFHSRPEGFANIEFRAGSNRLTRPPLIATLRKRADHPLGQWTAHYNLYLIQPQKADGKLKLSEPVLVTDHGLYMSRHAGNPSFAASGPDKTYITWAETTENNYVPGAPNFAATFDPVTLKITDRHFTGFAYPPNDGHDSPGIVLDPKGYVHTMTGGHGENFVYSHSTEPYSTAGMTDPVPVLKNGWKEFGIDRGRQSYLSFVCTADGALHTVFRQWLKGTEPYFQDGYCGSLAYQRRDADGTWDTQARQLVIPPLDGYSIYYQTMVLDRKDRIFLSYGYRSEHKEYGTGEAENHYLALLMSPDSGKTWRLMTTQDFADGMSADVSSDAHLSPAKLTGVVIGPDGKALAGARVAAMFTSVTSDKDGRFVFPEVLSDEFDLIAESAGCASRTVPVKFGGAGSKDVSVRLDVARPAPPAPAAHAP